MKMRLCEITSLRNALLDASDTSERFVYGADVRIYLGDLAHGSSLGGRLSELSGRSVVIKTHDQFVTALALIELDGVARRLIICPPDLSSEHLSSLIVDVDADAIVTDASLSEQGEYGNCLRVSCSSAIVPMDR